MFLYTSLHNFITFFPCFDCFFSLFIQFSLKFESTIAENIERFSYIDFSVIWFEFVSLFCVLLFNNKYAHSMFGWWWWFSRSKHKYRILFTSHWCDELIYTYTCYMYIQYTINIESLTTSVDGCCAVYLCWRLWLFFIFFCCPLLCTYIQA